MAGDAKGLEFGKLIRRLRKEKRLSQTALAAAVRVTRQAIGDWETKPFIEPQFAHLKRAAVALGVTVGELQAKLESADSDAGLLLDRRVWALFVKDYLQSELGRDTPPRVAERLLRTQSRTFSRQLVHAIRQEVEGRTGGRRR